MSRKQQTLRPSAALPLLSSPPPRARGLMLAWLTALFAARWLIPTEGAVEGMTLWLVQLVLLTAVARLAWLWRFGEQPLRFDAMDGAIALLIAAQVASTLRVVVGLGNGNARAAINVAWEWVGSGVWIWMLRRELTSSRAVQQLCWGLSLTAGVLAGYGLWQHYVGYDEMTREYDRLTTEHDRLAASGTDGRRLQSLRAEMAQQEIPVEPAARFSLEQRLKRSREPLGLFALTNTFAGLLVVMLLVSLGLLRTTSYFDGLSNRRVGQAALRRAGPPDILSGPSGGPALEASLSHPTSSQVRQSNYSSRVVTVALALTIAFCLVLTKSRTAWVGLSAGLGWWSLRMFAARWRRDTEPANEGHRSLRVWIASGAIVFVIIVAAAAVSGGLDKAVLSESPKSLRYRLEWWHGTWATIREHFWLGTGSGNFRDYYLAHKLPESSEEIADPHNFILDVWANAGTFGLIGLLACVGLMVGQVFNLPGQKTSDAGQVENLPHESGWTSPAAWGAGLAFPLAAVGMEFFGHGFDERLWWLGGIWWGLWLLCRRTRESSDRSLTSLSKKCEIDSPQRQQGSESTKIQPSNSLAYATGYIFQQALTTSATTVIGPPILTWSLEAGNVALLVHLLGAGGIAMPAITQLLWLVWALRVACSESMVFERDEKSPSESASGGVKVGRLPAGVSALAAGGLFVLCWWTATMPEILCRTSLQIGDAEWRRGQFAAANQRYLAASRADPYAIEPLERLADAAFQRWQATQAEHDFDESVTHQQAVLTRLPFASRPYRRLGQLWMARFERSHQEQHAARAVAAFAFAVEYYPHHAGLLSESAIASELAGLNEQARETARRAVRQDDLNRSAGHSDKYLDDQTRRRVARLAGELSEPN